MLRKSAGQHSSLTQPRVQLARMGSGSSPQPDRSYLRDHDEVLIQPAGALQGIEMLRFHVGPKSNHHTALGNKIRGFKADDSRGVEAAVAASTRAGRKDGKGQQPTNDRGRLNSWASRKKISLKVGLDDQLNFEFTRNKNSMNVFMIRLRRVYRA